MKSARLGPFHRALGEQDRAEGGRIAERLRGERAEEEQREVGRELRPLRLGAGREQAVLAAQRDRRGDRRRDREREPVPDDVVVPGDVEQITGSEAEQTLGGEDQPVRTEAAVARQRAACDVLHRVGGERDDEADEQDLLAVEQAVDERGERGEEQRDHDQRAGEHRARRTRPS